MNTEMQRKSVAARHMYHCYICFNTEDNRRVGTHIFRALIHTWNRWPGQNAIRDLSGISLSSVGFANTYKTYHVSYHAGNVYIVAFADEILTKRCVISAISNNKQNMDQYNFHGWVSPKVKGG